MGGRESGKERKMTISIVKVKTESGFVLIRIRSDEIFSDWNCDKMEYIVEAFDRDDQSYPIEKSVYLDKYKATEVFRRYCEKYRLKRNPDDKNGRTIRYLRELGYKAESAIADTEIGIRDSIRVFFVTKHGDKSYKCFKPNDISLENPKEIAKAISDYLVSSYSADIKKGREYYGLK